MVLYSEPTIHICGHKELPFVGISQIKYDVELINCNTHTWSLASCLRSAQSFAPSSWSSQPMENKILCLNQQCCSHLKHGLILSKKLKIEYSSNIDIFKLYLVQMYYSLFHAQAVFRSLINLLITDIWKNSWSMLYNKTYQSNVSSIIRLKSFSCYNKLCSLKAYLFVFIIIMHY